MSDVKQTNLFRGILGIFPFRHMKLSAPEKIEKALQKAAKYVIMNKGNTAQRDARVSLAYYSGILYRNFLTYASKPAKFLYNLTCKHGGLHSAHQTPHDAAIKVCDKKY